METLQQPVGAAPVSEYDAFLSYSHAADGLLAPRLQAGLQRFAKPWWRRRAVRVFQDESSLSANPHLWSSITEALDEAEWFVLLLSPEAASSEWVNREIAYWREHRPAERLLPVLTDGSFAWDGDVTGTAVPEALRGAFVEEPRWVDLRFARADEHLDLKDPRFADSVADISSAIRGVPKDELASEEVRQHRRTLRSAWAAVALVLLLAVTAVTFGLRSGANAREARGRELAASAVAEAAEDAQLALLLALAAVDELPDGAAPGPVIENGLRTAMAADRLLGRYDAHAAPGPSQLDISNDGRFVAFVSSVSRTVEVLDAETLEPVWSQVLDTQDPPRWVAFSSAGTYVVVSHADASWPNFETYVDGDPVGDPDAGFRVLDARDGGLVHLHTVPGACVVNVTPGGFHEERGLLGFGSETCGQTSQPGTIHFLETQGWTEVHRREPVGNEAHVVIADAAPVAAAFSGFNSGTDSWLLDTSSFEEIREIDFPWGDVSPDGGLLAGAQFDNAVSGVVLETLEGDVVDRFTRDLEFAWDPSFAPDGGSLAYATFGDVTLVVDPATGEELQLLRTGPTERAALRGDVLFTVWDGVVSRWDASGLQVGDLDTVPLGLWVNGNSIKWARDTVYAHVADRSTGAWFFYPVGSDGSLGEPIPDDDILANVPIADGRVAVLRGRELGDSEFEIGPLEVWDLDTGQPQVVLGCWLPEREAYRHERCPDGTRHPAGQLTTGSRDGDELMIIDWLYEDDVPAEAYATIYDTATLTVRERISLGELDATYSQLQRSLLTDDHLILHIADGQRIRIMDRASGEWLDFDQRNAEPWRLEHDRSRNRIWTVNQGETLWVLDLDDLTIRQVTEPLPTSVRALATSPSGAKIAAGGSDDVLRIFADSGELLHLIPLQNPSDASWLDETHLAVGTGNGPWTVITLDPDELVEIARSRVKRGLTTGECQFYGIDPCPTLEELRGR